MSVSVWEEWRVEEKVSSRVSRVERRSERFKRGVGESGCMDLRRVEWERRGRGGGGGGGEEREKEEREVRRWEVAARRMESDVVDVEEMEREL